MPVRLKDSPKAQRSRMQHAEWLGRTTALIIVSENDIYLRQSPTDEEDIRLTHTGIPGIVYNGITDWLYQGMTFKYLIKVLKFTNCVALIYRGNISIS